MSQLTTLIELSVILSIFFVILFFLYYRYLNIKTEMDVVADENGYYDYGSYFREKKKSVSFFSTNAFILNDAKSIGIRYLITSIIFFFIAGTFGVIMRVSLIEPNPTLFSGKTVLYDILTTEHSVLMIYMWAVGSAMGLAYYLLPSFLKVREDKYGSISSTAYWIYLLGGLFILFSRTSTRWYFYPPLALQLNPFGAGAYNWLAVIGMEMIFIGITIASIIVVRMIIMDRDESVPLSKMPLFAWSVLFTLIMFLASAPFFMTGLVLLFYDFFNPIFFTGINGGTSPLGFAELFWVWGHPIVYIAILPQFGLIYEILPKFTGKKVFSYSSGVVALGLLLPFSELVWGHHLMNSGLGKDWAVFFSMTSFLVVIPSAITIFNYIGTIWSSEKIRLTTPMLFVINGIIDFIIGGIAGVYLAMVLGNEQAHGTYFVTGHFHFIFMGVTVGVAFATIYMLWPSITNGRTYSVKLANWHFVFTSVGSFLMSMGWLVGGFIGMPRYVAGYFARYQAYQDTAILGGVIIGIGQLFFIANLILSYLHEPSVEPRNVLEDTYNLNGGDELSQGEETPIKTPSPVGGE
ncbi:cytochrome c oxidase subunit I [Caldiplasma sukawensis]